MLKFSPANAKIEELLKVKALLKYLNKRKVYSFDLLSGVNCPYAKDCKSQAVVGQDGKRHIEDGPHTQFRCFSASQEVLFTGVYNLRKHNADIILPTAAKSVSRAVELLHGHLPKNAGIIRIHVGGDFKTKNYMAAWLQVAAKNPTILFYAYTKSLPFWVALRSQIDSLPNFVLTASKGGMRDDLIDTHKFRQAVVVYSEAEAKKLGLPIDHDDSHAADPSIKGESFALLIHGTQPAKSEAGKAVRALNGKGSYSK